MTNTLQMDFNFDEPSEMQRFVEKVKEGMVDDLFVSADMLTNHFQEAKTKELIHELKIYLNKKEQKPVPLVTAPTPVMQNLKAEKEAQRLQQLNEKEKLRNSGYPQIFAEEGFLLFNILVANYTKDNHSPIAKFSNLFHFFKYEQLICCTKLEYIDFVAEEYDVHMSKVLPTTIKYHDYIMPLLSRMRKLKGIEQVGNRNGTETE